MASPSGTGGTAARDSGLLPLGRSVIGSLFARRHESVHLHDLARQSARHARQMRDWRRGDAR